MMVVAIIGLVMAMGIPAILRIGHQGPLRKAVNDVMEICSHARAMAILHNQTTLVVFHPQSGTVAYGGAVAPPPPQDADNAPADFPRAAGKAAPDAAPVENTPAAALSPKVTTSTQFGPDVSVEMLDVNMRDCLKNDEARVRFFPDGTSDELTLVLHSGDQWRKISIELTTALASVKEIR
ncbi:MAG: hypothetical protein KGJ60_02065 [Verrucomicrobiota bacterium]|nr:hypothetical protein [Verrucomicrobiota bacterium]